MNVFSNNAHDLFMIATRVAGFNASELIVEITRRQGGCDRKISMNTVDNAMGTIQRRHDKAAKMKDQMKGGA